MQRTRSTEEFEAKVTALVGQFGGEEVSFPKERARVSKGGILELWVAGTMGPTRTFAFPTQVIAQKIAVPLGEVLGAESGHPIDFEVSDATKPVFSRMLKLTLQSLMGQLDGVEVAMDTDWAKSPFTALAEVKDGSTGATMFVGFTDSRKASTFQQGATYSQMTTGRPVLCKVMLRKSTAEIEEESGLQVVADLERKVSASANPSVMIAPSLRGIPGIAVSGIAFAACGKCSPACKPGRGFLLLLEPPLPRR